MDREPSEAEMLLLEFITTAREPTWVIVRGIPEMAGDRSRVDTLLSGLEDRGLVDHTRELSMEPNPAKNMEPTNWWGLTEAGWRLLGEKPSPSYG